MPMVFQVLNSLEAAEMKIVRVTNIFVVHRYSTQVSFRFLVFSFDLYDPRRVYRSAGGSSPVFSSCSKAQKTV